MDIIMDIKGYLFMRCKDIFFHARYFVYILLYHLCPAISSQMSFILSSHILQFILTYPIISCFFILIFILIYPNLIESFYPFVSCQFIPFILIFYSFYPDIYPAGYSIRFWADPDRRGVLLDWTLFCMSCSGTG